MLFKLMVFLLSSCSLFSYEVSMLSMFRDESRYLKEWIDYHRHIGIEHFWLYNDHSADDWEDVLKPYIDEGIVDVISWEEGGDIYGYTRQPAIYCHGITRAVGKTKWLAILDIDEFLVPMKEKSIQECLKIHYPLASAIYLNWRNFGTGKVTIPEGESLLYYLVNCSLNSHSDNKAGKCIVRPECLFLETLWTPHHYDLLPGYSYVDGNAEPIPWNGTDFEFGHAYHDKYLRVNHYVLRDEYFFWNFRYKRTGNKELLMEHYDSFNVMKDRAIHRLINTMYPKYFQN